jgi:hypothetical protein
VASAIVAIVAAVLGAVVGALAADRFQRRQVSDKVQFLTWRVAFDRGAFKGLYLWHSDQVPFVRAIKETIQAINTGVTKDQQRRCKGKSELHRREWHAVMDDVERKLHHMVVIVQRNLDGIQISDEERRAVDITRDDVVTMMNRAWKELNIDPLPLPTSYESLSVPD